jgi:hypothetical protein
VVVVLAFGIAISVLFASPFADLRRSITASFLTDLLGVTVAITGDVAVKVSMDGNTTVTIADVMLTHPGRELEEDQRIDQIDFAFPTWSAIAANISVSAFALQGVRVDILISDTAVGEGEMDAITAVGWTTSSFLNNPISSNFSVANSAFTILDGENGWSERVVIQALTFLGENSSGTIKMQGHGTFNAVPLTLEDVIDAQQQTGLRAIDISFSIPGSASNENGIVAISKEAAQLDVRAG